MYQGMVGMACLTAIAICAIFKLPADAATIATAVVSGIAGFTVGGVAGAASGAKDKIKDILNKTK